MPEITNLTTVLVCGSRDGYSQTYRGSNVIDSVAVALDEAQRDLWQGAFRHLVTGSFNPRRPISVDSQAVLWALSREVPFTVVPARWETGTRRGPAEGPIRNGVMLRLFDVCCVLAFPGGRGTDDMKRQAKRAGVPVWRWTGQEWRLEQ